jgi:L-ascorbate metabolism protein UlaG (beta-lactamase superfamily)|tara:strand:+ start:329 stop:556 length:228 start_codon:yes stop_codon:yes gene_type:complete
MGISHTTPEEAIQIGVDIGANFYIGMHWGTIVLSDELPFEPPKRFAQNARMRGISSGKIWIMKIGETKKLVFSEP